MREDKRNLGVNLENYIKIIMLEYIDKIPPERLEFLQNINNYADYIKIEDTGTISCLANNKGIYFPLLAYEVIPSFYTHPLYGTNKSHKAYKKGGLIINDNTFEDYINHAIIAGLSPEEYFQETLLHETLHFCGTRGNDPLREGFTELKTRELAQKYRLLTSGCGYPKEVQIVYRLQQLFGKETCDIITFAKDNREIETRLAFTHGEQAANLYFDVREEMESSFRPYIQKTKEYSGITAPLKKLEEYSKIDYTKVHQIIDNYEQNHKQDRITK